MLKHIVMWKLKEFAEGKTKAENALIMKESLERLVGIVPEIISLQVGINEKESDMAYDAVLISTFANAEALARYKVHPEHVKVSNYCKKFEKAGLSSISRNKKRVKYIDTFQVKERKTGLEPATPTLGRSCSTN